VARTSTAIRDCTNATAQPRTRSAWWVRALAALPLPALYAFASFLAWISYRVFPYRQHVIRENVSKAFPELDQAGIRDLMRRYYANFAQVLVEVIKAARLPASEIRRRVRIVNPEAVRESLAAGSPVLLVAAHQCNWEWMLLSLSLEFDCPVDAAYKPLVDRWAECELLKVRSRFGARLVPAQDLLPDIIRRRGVVRLIAMVADQEPTTSERRYWVRFLNRDTAFFAGPEDIARATRFPVFFVGMRRVARGCYELKLEPLAAAGESLPPGELTSRYVRLVEAQIRASPADWPWSHKRWKLKKTLYNCRTC